MGKQKKEKTNIFGRLDVFCKFLQGKKVGVPKGYQLRVNISDFFDAGNRQALKYAHEKQTLKGLLPVLHLRTSVAPIISDKKNGALRININEVTDEWNRLALEYAKRRRGAAK